MKNLHIHFGIHRTGTTSIHHNLLNNTEELENQGYIYPDLGVNHRHVRTAWDLISKKIEPNELVKKINREAGTEEYTVLLSSEDFCQLKSSSWLKILTENFNVSASVYLKRQDLWLESWYNQHIKWPWSAKFSTSLPEFFVDNSNDFYWIDYSWLIGRMLEFIPRDKLYVQVMEKSSGINTTKDLFQLLGINERKIVFKKPTNESLTKAQLDIARRIDLLRVKPKARRKILNSLRNLDIEEDDGSQFVFSPSVRKKILRKFRVTNKQVAENIFNRKELFEDSISYPNPVEIPEEKISRKYIPELLRALSES